MTKETITYDVYDYDELEEEVKKKVRENLYEVITNLRFSCLEEDLKQLINEKYDVKDAKFMYSLGYCQGDGLSFESDDLLKSKYFIDKVKEKLDKKEKATFTKLVKDGTLYYVRAKHWNPHYEYASKYDIEECIDLPYCKSLTKLQEEVIEKALDIIKDTYLHVCKKLEEYGYSYYEVDEEDIKDHIEINELRFLRSGTIWWM